MCNSNCKVNWLCYADMVISIASRMRESECSHLLLGLLSIMITSIGSYWCQAPSSYHFICILFSYHKILQGYLIISISQMSKLRGCKSPQSHIGSYFWSSNSNPGLSDSRVYFFIYSFIVPLYVMNLDEGK